MKQEENDKKTFEDAGTRFSWNVSAVRILGLEIGRLGDEHDQAVSKNLVKELSKIIPELALPDSPVVRISISRERDVERPIGDPEGNPLPVSHKGDPPSKVNIGSEQMAMLHKAVTALSQRPPIQGTLLRNGALMTLVSFFEGLVSEILHVFYRKHPEALPAESRSLSLSDLRALGSIEDAEQFLTSKEIDSLLRESLDEQLSHYSKRLQVDIAPLNGFRSELAEVFQRRNLLVHNSGNVNRYYLE